jgi:hypothetical protein
MNIREINNYFGSPEYKSYQSKINVLDALNSVDEDVAIAAINEYLAGIFSSHKTRAYKLGFRDARHEAAELVAGNTELHRDIMNLRANNA